MDYTERELRELRESLEKTESDLEKMLKENRKTQTKLARILRMKPAMTKGKEQDK